MIHRHQQEPNDARVGVTTRIWFFATMMMAIASMPRSTAGLGHVIISLAILAGAGVATAAVWGAFSKREEKQLPPAPKDLSELEERLSNLETITRYEHMLESRKEQPDAQAQSEPKRKLAML
jgi:hypothetical protein